MGAVARRAVGGWMELVVFVGTEPVEGETGAVASRGWVTPAPGRARKVMRTVSFFSGTAEVFGVEDVWFSSLMETLALDSGYSITFSDQGGCASIQFSPFAAAERFFLPAGIDGPGIRAEKGRSVHSSRTGGL